MEDDGDISFPDGVKPDCFDGDCPTGFDKLLPSDLRILEIRGLLAGLHMFHLAERICNEYDVTVTDLKILAEIEDVIRELSKDGDREPVKAVTNNGG